MASLNKKIKIDLKEIVFSSEERKSFCDIFIYEPENIEEQSLGNLYIVGEIVDFSENSSYLINLLVSIAKKEFYSNSNLGKSTMESLESSLHKVNSTLSKLAEQGNVDWIGNLNMTYCAYMNNELHISQTGKIKTILIRDEQITDIGKNITNEEKPHPFKTFTNIANGELEDGDLVLFATPKLFEIFPIEKLKQLAFSLTIEDLAKTIQDSIEKESDIKTMGLLLMKIGKESEEKLTQIKIKPQRKNVEKKREEKEAIPILQEKLEDPANFNKTEKEILQPSKTTTKKEKLSLEDIIDKYEKKEPSDKIEVKKEVDKNLELFKEKHQNEKSRTNNFMDSLDEESETKIEYLLKKLKEIFVLIKNKIILPIFKFVRKSKSEDESPQQVKVSSNRKKLILVTFVLIAFVFIGGLIFKNYTDSENEKFSAYASLLIQAENKIEKAEIDSISNQPEARKSLIEAKNIINTRNISLDDKERYKQLSAKASVLLEEIQKQLDIIDLVSRIEDPIVIIDFNQIEDIKDPKKIFKDNKKYFVFDSKNGTLNGISFTKKDITDFKIKIKDNANLSSASTSMEKTKEIIFATDSNKMGIFDISKETFSTIEIELPENISKLKDLSAYSNFLYLLDSNQIYKYKKLTNSFASGKTWFEKENENIEDVISMAIDGSIYLLNSNGLIDKFNRGRKVIGFSTESPSELISSSSEIYTKPEFEYLYITDSAKNRIVLFNKISGELLGQYISNKFDNLKNIIVDEKNKKIYILNGDKIFEVEIEI
ncbi:MAG: hypothetical protein U9P70_03060 [Patescibacteria group bacterium]|nr:hypothetical protein [Patescibacteria group bacterium]